FVYFSENKFPGQVKGLFFAKRAPIYYESSLEVQGTQYKIETTSRSLDHQNGRYR
uniref:Uncharacterized protein n=1 Tax=Triticum urartu TaxID=4572 RepID=A0A8R7QVW2_TRIUA